VQNYFSIEKKVILITGAGRGIGEHLATNLAKQNAIVYGFDKKFPSSKYNFNTLICDITNQKKFSSICRKIFSDNKKIDVLINCAGVSFSEQKQNSIYPNKNWEKTIAINLTAAFTCSQTVISYMIKKKSGSIINITSINAEFGFPRNPAYVASKGGLKMLGKSLAKDWGNYGIRVNNLGPGYILTDMTSIRFKNKKTREARSKRTLLGRWGTKDDLVGPCIFLASDASQYVTGQDLYVDGGWSANGLSE
jgi:NAD(P)-dependent dehydrogenase (short-subunit alcohol dehydrogenase family)